MDFEKTGKLVCDVVSSSSPKMLFDRYSKLSLEEWHQIYQFGLLYNLLPLLYAKLFKQNLLGLLPVGIKSIFQNQYNAASCSALKRQFEIKRILKILHDSDIDVILLKGGYVAEVYYENSAERPMSDIDLLVKQQDIYKTADILVTSAGCTYVQDKNNDSAILDSAEDLDRLKKFTKHISEIKTPKGFSLEIHWALDYSNESSNTLINMVEIWKSKKAVQICGTDCYVINLELCLLYLCVNIAEDSFKQKILQLYDIFLIVGNSEIDWNFLVNKAKEWNCHRALYCVLIAENKLFNLQIPDNVSKELDLLAPCTLEIRNVMFDSIFADLSVAEQYEDKIGSEFSTKSVKDKIKFFYWSFWSKDKIFYHYGIQKGTLRLFVCRIKRTIYLLKKYLSSFLHLYIMNPDKKDKIKKRNISSFKILDNWLKK